MRGRRHVLVVDDDPAMLAMYRLGLEQHGFEVSTLPDARNLNDTVAERRPDILVLDWELPMVFGDVALERLRQTDAGRSLKTLMLSNHPGTANGAIDRAFGSGALAWLAKVDTTPVDLARRLDQALSEDGAAQ